MVKRLHYIISLLLLSNFVLAQQEEMIDTVYVSTSKTTTLMFPQDVILFDIGSEEFGGIKSAGLLLLKAVSNEAQPTSILVQYGKDIYHATVAYRANPSKTFIDFRKVDLPKVPNENRTAKKDSTKTLENEVTEKRLNLLLSDTRVKYKSTAIQKENLILSLADMMVDEEHVYLKMLFVNSSKLDYAFDFFEFIYKDPSDKKELKGEFERKNVYPLNSNKIEGIRGKDKRYIGFVIPRYSLSKKGELEVVAREKKGSRVLELIIPFTMILEASPVNLRN